MKNKGTRSGKSKKSDAPVAQEKNPRFMTPTGYAKKKGMHVNSIYQAVKDGRIRYYNKDNKNFINADEADKTFVADSILESAPLSEDDPLKRQEGEMPPADQRMNVVHARSLREEFKARQEHLDYQRRKGELIPRSEVDASAFECARILRERMNAIPERISAELAAESDVQKVHFILSEAITKELMDLSEKYSEARVEKPLVAPQPEAAAETPENAITV